MSTNTLTTTKSKRKSVQKIGHLESLSQEFYRYCLEYNVKCIPNIRLLIPDKNIDCFGIKKYKEFCGYNAKKLTSRKFSDTKNGKNTEDCPDINLTCDYIEFSKLDVIEIDLKLFNVEANLLTSLYLTLNQTSNLKIMKLEHCNLKDEDIVTITDFLIDHPEMSEISVDGNPMENQNFYLIIQATNIKFLSLRMCQINDDGVEMLANELWSSKLNSINLASNYICDRGAEYIAKALRSNRILMNLNLSDNWITDVGCTKLMAVFQKFPLMREEILIRRRKMFEYAWKKSEWIKDMLMLSALTSSEKIFMNKETSSKNLKSEKKNDRRGSNSSKGSNALQTRKGKRCSKLLEKKASLELQYDNEYGKSNHPFVRDCFPEREQIFCIGNFSLMFLSLAYNKITTESIKDIIQMLEYQRNIATQTGYVEGVLHINLDGNVNSDSTVMESLFEQFQSNIKTFSGCSIKK